MEKKKVPYLKLGVVIWVETDTIILSVGVHQPGHTEWFQHELILVLPGTTPSPLELAVTLRL